MTTQTQTRTCDDCNPVWDRKFNVKAIQLCPLHATSPALKEALENAREVLFYSGHEITVAKIDALLASIEGQS